MEKKWFNSIFEGSESLENASPITKNSVKVSNYDDEPLFKKPKIRRNSNNETNEKVSKSTLSKTLSCPGGSTTITDNKFHRNSSLNMNFKSANWCENFAPKTIDDLAVHPKKIEELQNWLCTAEQNINQRVGCSSILLITGPPGSGKTATVQVIANKMGYTINEWINPVDIALNEKSNYYNDGGGSIGERNGKFFAEISENQCQQFSQFLFQASRYKSLYDVSNRQQQTTATNKRLILVEDFPNIFLKDVDGFHEILGNYMNFGKCPLLFIVADTRSKKLDLTYSLFDDSAKQRFQISQINFNALSVTMLKKGLKRMCGLMNQKGFNQYYKPVTPDLIESLILTAQGDIRNAVINLHFGSLKNSGKLSTTGAGASSSITNKLKSKSKLKSVGCDETITVMHALGRVFNPKYQENLTKKRHKQLVYSPEKLCDDFLSQPMSFLNLLHTNYVDHCKELTDVTKISNMLSFANVAMEKWMEDSMTDIGLNIAIRATMAYNSTPATGWMPVRGQKKLPSLNLNEELQRLGLSPNSISSTLLATDYRTHGKIIKSIT